MMHALMEVVPNQFAWEILEVLLFVKVQSRPSKVLNKTYEAYNTYKTYNPAKPTRLTRPTRPNKLKTLMS